MRDSANDLGHKARLVAFASVRYRSHIWSISLRKKHVKRGILYHLVVIMCKGENACEGERKAKIQEFFRGAPIPRKKVCVALHFCMRFQNFDRISVCISNVEHEWFLKLVREFYLLNKGVFLDLLRFLFQPKVVEPTLAYRYHLWTFRHFLIVPYMELFAARCEFLTTFAKLLFVVIRLRGVDGVQPNGCVYVVIFFGERDGRCGCVLLRPHNVHPHVSLFRAQDGSLTVFVVCDKIHVRMCVEIFHSLRGNRFEGFLLATIASMIFLLVSGSIGSSISSMNASSRTISSINFFPCSKSFFTTLNGSV